MNNSTPTPTPTPTTTVHFSHHTLLPTYIQLKPSFSGMLPPPTTAATTTTTSLFLPPQNNNSSITDQNIIQILLPCIFIVLAFFVFYWVKIGISLRLDNKCRQRPGLSRSNLSLHNIQCNEVIGHGSFGTVLKGKYGGMDIALKVTCIEKYNRWFNEKTVLLDNNDNENVVKLIDYGVKSLRDGEKYLCLVLEYADMDCLRNFLQKSSIGVEQCLFYASTLTSAISYIHSDRNGLGSKKSPVIHQDIKSANVLLSSAKGCILGDFGLASQLCDLPICEKTQVGTPRYMSPEKLKGSCIEGHYLLKSDIYALGLVLYEMACRCYFVDSVGHLFLPNEYQTPYSDMIGCNPTINEMKNVVLYQRIRPTVPKAWSTNKALSTFREIIVECWSQDADRRPVAKTVEKCVRTLEAQYGCASTRISILDAV